MYSTNKMAHWLPFSWQPPAKKMANYNNLDSYRLRGKIRRSVRGHGQADNLVDSNPLDKDFGRVPPAQTALWYNYGRGGLHPPHVNFPIPNNGRSLLEVDDLDSSNYYNFRK
jgi:hypothetical protein